MELPEENEESELLLAYCKDHVDKMFAKSMVRIQMCGVSLTIRLSQFLPFSSLSFFSLHSPKHTSINLLAISPHCTLQRKTFLQTQRTQWRRDVHPDEVAREHST